MNGQANKAVAGAGVGYAIAWLAALTLQETGWLVLEAAEKDGLVGALTILFSYGARWLPEPQ